MTTVDMMEVTAIAIRTSNAEMNKLTMVVVTLPATIQSAKWMVKIVGAQKVVILLSSMMTHVTQNAIMQTATMMEMTATVTKIICAKLRT